MYSQYFQRVSERLKSLCYSCLPTTFDKLRQATPGSSFALVVTPLIAIMKDQVAGHCCHTCCGKLIAFLQNKLGYWSVTRSFLSMQRGGNARLANNYVLRTTYATISSTTYNYPPSNYTCIHVQYNNIHNN